MRIVDHSPLRDFVTQIYEAVGVPDDTAATVARLQVDADLCGHESHGVVSTSTYLAGVEKGSIVPDAALDVMVTAPSTAIIDGHWGFGYAVTSKAADIAADMAATQGAAALTIRRQGHVGRLGAYTSMIAERGMIGLLTADSGASTKIAVPFGGRDPRLGSNPISIAVPTAKTIVCFDMATTVVAAGKVMVARIKHQDIPLGWIVTKDGQPSTNPQDFVDGGALLPLGGDQGHKGYGLSFIIEVLSGLLTGIGFGVDPKGRHNDGCFMGAFDISRFRDLNDFKQEMDEFIHFVKSSPLAPGATEILYPGELERRQKEARLRDGIPLQERVCDRLVEIGKTHGIVAPSAIKA